MLKIGDLVKFSERKTFEENKHSLGIVTNIAINDDSHTYKVWWINLDKTYEGYCEDELIRLCE